MKCNENSAANLNITMPLDSDERAASVYDPWVESA